MSKQPERIRVETDGRVARVTFDRPPLNVLDIPSIEKLAKALDALASDKTVDLVVLSGAGDRGFSAGVDIQDHTPDKVKDMLKSFHGLFRTMVTWDKISIASVHGICLGGGFELALACDLFVCEENARLGLPEIDVGCFPPVAVAALPERVGPQVAADWALTGRAVSADEAAMLGLVSRLATEGTLKKTLDDLIAALLSKSSAVLRITARALRQGRGGALTEAIGRAEKIYFDDLLKTEDVHEGVASFIEKRKPAWRHR